MGYMVCVCVCVSAYYTFQVLTFFLVFAMELLQVKVDNVVQASFIGDWFADNWITGTYLPTLSLRPGNHRYFHVYVSPYQLLRSLWEMDECIYRFEFIGFENCCEGTNHIFEASVNGGLWTDALLALSPPLASNPCTNEYNWFRPFFLFLP